MGLKNLQRCTKLTGILILVFLGFQISAQTYPQNSLYLVDIYQVNPAYAGLERSLSINVNYRDQWAGFTANPKQFYLNAHLPVYLWDGGVGATISSDQLGPLRFNTLRLSYNRIFKTDFGIVSAAGSLGVRSSGYDGSALVTPDGIYDNNEINHLDPLLSNGNLNATKPSYGLGLFVGAKQFDFGLSIDNLFLESSVIEGVTTSHHDAVTIFGRFPISYRELIFYPSMLIKTDFAAYQTDISCITKSGNIFGGLSLRGYSPRSFDSVVILGGIRINDHYTITYSYDLGISSIRSVSEGAHEINVNYNLNKLLGLGLPPEIIYNPRNL